MEVIPTKLRNESQLLLRAFLTDFWLSNQCPASPALLKPRAPATATLHCSLAAGRSDTKIKLGDADSNRLLKWL